MSDDVITIDFGDGVSALERLTRTVIMMTDGALTRLTEAGYRRDIDFSIRVHDDGMPIWIDLKGQETFMVEVTSDSSRIFVKGKWLREFKPRRRGFFARLFGR